MCECQMSSFNKLTRQKEHVTLFHFNIPKHTIIHYLDCQITFDLVKPFLFVVSHDSFHSLCVWGYSLLYLCFIDMIVCAFVGSTDNHDDGVLSFEQQVIIHWWLEFVCVFFDPFWKINWWRKHLDFSKLSSRN